jgi:hypothetical protein
MSSATPKLAHQVNLVMIPVAVATAALVLTDTESPVRVWLTVLLFLFGAGSGLTQFLRLGERSLQFGMIVALSLAFDILVGQGLLSVHNLSADAAVCLLAGVTCIRPLYRPEPALEQPDEPAEPAEEDES